MSYTKVSEVSFGEKRLRSKKWLCLGSLGMLCSKKFVYNFQNVCSSLFQMTMPSHKNYKPHFVLHSDLNIVSKICCSVCRRIVGIAHVEDLESIKDASRRAECERAALHCAKTILKGRRQFETIEQVIEHIQSFDQD